MKDFSITITPAAIKHINSMLEKEKNAIAFRLSVTTTGCSGRAYKPELIRTIDESDTKISFDGFELYIETKSLDILNGLNIDFVSQDIGHGLKQKRLTYKNPNESGRCGCGESFITEDDEHV